MGRTEHRKRYSIIWFNIIISITLALGVVFYANRQQQASRVQAEGSFMGTTQVISGIADNYFVETESVCSTWATYITEMGMTMEQAIRYLLASRIRSDVYAQIIWADDLTGLSRESRLADREDYSVSYANRAHLFAGWTDRSRVFVTPRFTNPVTGTYAIAFCRQVELLDGENKREAILMRVIPNSYLSSRWVFPSNYEEASVAIIDEQGKYILKPDSMKNEDFYSFLYSYNQGSIDQDKLRERIINEDSGLLRAGNGSGREFTWCFRHLEANPGWLVVMAVPSSEMTEQRVDWFLPALILVTLMLLLTVDMMHFTRIRKRDQAVQMQLARQGERLKQALDEAECASRAKTTFLNHMSHDIRTPMNAIMGYTSIALKQEAAPQIHSCLEKIEQSSAHLLTLINDVLDISRIESGRVENHPQPVDIRSVADTVLSIAEGFMKDRDLTFVVERQPMEQPYVLADAMRIRDVLVNILSNAIKFTPDGGTIAFHAAWRPGKSEQEILVTYRIADSGIGMSPEFKEHVFDEFAQEESGARTRYKGTGLGLTITKRYVELMNGTITVESEKGKGTTFVVELPFELTEAPAQAQELPVEKADLQGVHALLAEDNELNAEIATMQLEEAGMVITRVSNVKEAVELFEQRPAGTFDLILMDIMMPEMNGYEASEAIRALADRPDGRDIPIIAMTANAFAEDVQQAMEAGMNAHIAKPLVMDEVFRTIRRNVRSRL